MTNGKTIFCCGAVTDHKNPLGWHEKVRSQARNHTVINPYELTEEYHIVHDVSQAFTEELLPAVDDADLIIAHWKEGQSLPSLGIYLERARQQDIPIVVWYSGEQQQQDIAPSIRFISDKRIYMDMEKTVSVGLGLIGDSSQFTIS